VTTLPRRLRTADRHTLVLVALCVLAVPLLLVAGHGLTFIADEWSFINGRQAWDVATLMRPHNEHWSLIPVLIYKLLLATVGLRTYVPYQLALLALHLATVAALFQLLRREAGSFLALLGAALFLFLGYGAESLLWPAEIGWNAAMASGAWALVLALRASGHADIWAAVLLVVAVASSGVGLFFVLAVGLAILLTAVDRRRLWVVLPAIVIYGIWYLAYGQGAIGGLLDPARLSGVSEYVTLGVGNAFGRTTGWGPGPGAILAAVVIIATIWRLLGDRPVMFGAVVGLAGLLTQFGLTALTRAQMGAEQAASPRYVYTAAFFILLVLASWLATRVGSAVSRRQAIVVALLAVALISNAYGLTVVRSFVLNVSNDTRAAMQLITTYGGSPALPSNAGWLSVPSRDELTQLTSSFGSPLRDDLWPAAEPSPANLDAVILDLVGGAIVVSPAEASSESSPPATTDVSDATLTTDDECAVVTAVGPAPAVTSRVPAGASLLIAATAATGTGAPNASAAVSLYGTTLEKGTRSLTLPADARMRLSLPDIGAGAIWLVRFTFPANSQARLCLDSQER
jgi:hypothetical protein